MERPLLFGGSLVQQAVARRKQQILGGLYVPLANQDVQITELPQRDVTEGRRSQNRPFPRNCSNADLLQRVKQLYQLPRKKKVFERMGAENNAGVDSRYDWEQLQGSC